MPSLLIIDDEVDACESLKFLLEMKGWKVRTAHDGLSGIQAVEESVPNLVLLDIEFKGGINGWDALKEMKKVDPKIKVLILTGSVQELGLEKQIQESGALGLITKPIQIDTLEPTLHSYLK